MQCQNSQFTENLKLNKTLDNGSALHSISSDSAP